MAKSKPSNKKATKQPTTAKRPAGKKRPTKPSAKKPSAAKPRLKSLAKKTPAAVKPWAPFLKRLNREVLADETVRSRMPAELVQANWLGYPPATEKELRALEKRLRRPLPPSYRAFLQATNGWRYASTFVYELLPCAEVGWFADLQDGWIDCWLEGAGEEWSVSDKDYFVYGKKQDAGNFRLEYWRKTLMISKEGDSAIFLLNPEVVTPAGEWEAWMFANWFPGARRNRSFREMMEAELRTFVEIRNNRAERAKNAQS